MSYEVNANMIVYLIPSILPYFLSKAYFAPSFPVRSCSAWW